MNNQIIFIGDSLTEWGNWDKLFPNKNIVNFGIAGEKTYEILNRIEQIFKYNPSKIFLMMGINDLGENKSISEIADNYWELVNKVTQKCSNVEFFLISILPVDNNRWKNLGLTPTNINTVNKLIKDIAKDFNAKYLNIAPAFADKSGYLNNIFTTDGLHLSKDGYKEWKKEIENFI